MTRTTRTLVSVAAAAMALASLTVAPAAPSQGLSFRDSFDQLGPLAGTAPSDPYEIKNGDWEVVDIPDLLQGRRVLRQNSKAATPHEPVVFVRDQSYRSLSVQVTAALIDDVLAASLGIVFRAPVLEDQTADDANLYLFSAQKTGFVAGFTTGQTFSLWKRVGRGYYMLQKKVAGTWADLLQPHDYKVSMVGGHILAFVDGRLVIDHTDVPSPDVPTNNDPFPGLPYDEGSVGLRTSMGRAWFDDLVIVADDAGEGRSALFDAYVQYGIGGGIRRGTSLQAGPALRRLGIDFLDTGFVYGTPDFSRSLLEPLESAGASLGPTFNTVSRNGVVTSRARVLGFHQEFTDPAKQVSVILDANAIDTMARADCDGTASTVDLASATMTIVVTNGDKPDTVVGPFPLASTYSPNTTVIDLGIVKVIGHPRHRSTEPQRVEASALAIIFPEAGSGTSPVNVLGVPVAPGANPGELPTIEIEIANATAGRYCIERLEWGDD